MIKSILVCDDGSAGGRVACDYAMDLAVKLKARLTGLHVLDTRMLEGPLLADISGWLGAQPFSAQESQFRDLMQQKGETVLSAFEQRARDLGLTPATLLRMGHPPQAILDEEARAELVVMGRNGEHAEWTGDMTGSTVERVVRQSLKPCLVTPAAFRPVRRILCAYDGSGHASRALHEAIELALALAAPLVIVTVLEEPAWEHARDVSEDAIQLARAHECAAANMVVEGTPDGAILDQAAEQNSDLIVVGAFGHGRIREFILGSTTTQLIMKSKLPLLLVR
jgi:nucleotide-binding universal stress UspA family protein